MLAGCLWLAFPLCLCRTLHALRYTCYLGFVSVLLLTSSIMERCITANRHDPMHIKGLRSVAQPDVQAFPLSSPLLLPSMSTTLALLSTAPSHSPPHRCCCWSHDRACRAFPKAWSDVLLVWPIFILAFLAPFQILPVHSSLQDPTRDRLKIVIHSASSYVCPCAAFR